MNWTKLPKNYIPVMAHSAYFVPYFSSTGQVLPDILYSLLNQDPNLEEGLVEKLIAD